LDGERKRSYKSCSLVLLSGKPAIINMYTVVVQEYFQERVTAWLDTVGKNLLGIKHHWLRYEFAPSRGQIHAHMLAICDNKEVLKHCLALKYDKQKLALYLSSWLSDTLQMTATINDKWKDIDAKREVHPSTLKFTDLKEDDVGKDVVLCQKSFQMHKCSKFCMRARQKTSKKENKDQKKRRYCRCGAGIERVYGSCDTPGFPIIRNPVLSRDVRGYDRVDLPRNDTRVVQGSAYLFQGWRGNCDIRYLIYSSDGDKVTRWTPVILAE
jgi:hypothetical protein